MQLKLHSSQGQSVDMSWADSSTNNKKLGEPYQSCTCPCSVGTRKGTDNFQPVVGAVHEMLPLPLPSLPALCLGISFEALLEHLRLSCHYCCC
jgi:hypothetical protein